MVNPLPSEDRETAVEAGGLGRKPTEALSAEPSFASTALAGEDARRRADTFARPAREKFKRHLLLFVVANCALVLANLLLLPGHVLFYYVTIVWAIVLGDNFLWAYAVDPDRDVAERAALHAERDRQRDGRNGDEKRDEES